MFGANSVHHRLDGGVEDLHNHHQPADDHQQQDLGQTIPHQKGQRHQQYDQQQLLTKRASCSQADESPFML